MVMEQWKQYVLARVTQENALSVLYHDYAMANYSWVLSIVNVVEYINNGEARIIQRQKLLQTIMSKCLNSGVNLL